MKNSFFQFTNPCLADLEFHINNEFSNDSISELQLQIKTSVNITRSETDNTAFVLLSIELGEKSSNLPFCLNISMGANFKWGDDGQNVDALLSQNAPSLLLSYARPIIANVTNSSPFPVYHLPFMDFTQPSD